MGWGREKTKENTEGFIHPPPQGSLSSCLARLIGIIFLVVYARLYNVQENKKKTWHLWHMHSAICICGETKNIKRLGNDQRRGRRGDVGYQPPTSDRLRDTFD